MQTLSIRTKLIAAFAALLLFTLGLGALALDRVQSLRADAAELAGNWVPSLRALGAMDNALANQRAQLLLHLSARDARARQEIERRIAETAHTLAEGRRAYEPLATSPQERAGLAEFDRHRAAYEQHVAQLLDLSRRAGEAERAWRVFEEGVQPSFAAAREALQRLVRFNGENADAASRRADATAGAGRALILGLLAAAAAIGAALAFAIIRGVDRDIASVLAPMRQLAAGDLSATVPALPERTEIGAIAGALQRFKEALVEKREADARAAAEAAAKAARAERMAANVARFEAEAGESLRKVKDAAAELDSTADAMARTAQQGLERATSVAAASEQASTNVQTVAASAEQLAASIAEVARQVTESAQVARRAAEDARATDAAVASLSEAAQRIGEVVRLIGDIAGQTNLLALNATIEAARAGEAGKGFAVVASEVKQLAAQTAKATDQIGGQIAAMQAETSRAVEAIRGIGQTIEMMERITAQVAAAAEEQASATREITRSVTEAATGTRDVSQHAAGMTGEAQQAGAAAAQLRSSSQALAREAEALRAQVERFLAEVQAA
nr:methyl-accepting chemotaxis protein [Caldovatus aquaticus]